MRSDYSTANGAVIPRWKSSRRDLKQFHVRAGGNLEKELPDFNQLPTIHPSVRTMVLPLILNTTAVPFFADPPQPLNLNPSQRSIISDLMNEAASAIVDVIRQPEIRSVSINTDLSVPPNTPNTDTTFEFPEVPYTSEDSDFENIQTEKMLKKRKRIPSFKKPRVLRKKLLFQDFSADDEASSADDDAQELNLKLQLLSEATQSSDEENEESDDPEKWAKIGEELRIIADRFSDEIATDPEEESNKPDLLSLVNLMLPVSVPRSLWSALLSYAAWKIFKKFQWSSIFAPSSQLWYI